MTGAELRLVGTRGEPGAPDASRLLADASLALQRVVGVDAVPQLVAPGAEPLLGAVAGAGRDLVGRSPRWRARIASGPSAASSSSTPPHRSCSLHRGLRPGGLAPASADTRFSQGTGDVIRPGWVAPGRRPRGRASRTRPGSRGSEAGDT